MRMLLETIIAKLARAVLAKYQPTIVGITGSVGKTSCKEAVAALIGGEFRVRKTAKNYNNELGVPLTIISESDPQGSAIGWLRVIGEGVLLLLRRDNTYPQVLVLEMGADHPGDITRLVKLAPVDIGVVTSITPVHMEQYRSIAQLAKEKGEIFRLTNPQGAVVVNSDDQQVCAQAKKTKAKAVSVSMQTQTTDISASQVRLIADDANVGMQVKCRIADSTVPFFLPGVIAPHQVYSVLFAIGVGMLLDINIVSLIERVSLIQWPAGRMKLLAGVKGSYIIDDTYNASPAAMQAAIDVLMQLAIPNPGHRIAVLGSMNELGDQQEQSHHQIGLHIAKNPPDLLITFGHAAQAIGLGAVRAGMPEDRVVHATSHAEIVEMLTTFVSPRDIILCKGSQNNIRLEKVVKAILAKPEQAATVLVRQDVTWS